MTSCRRGRCVNLKKKKTNKQKKANEGTYRDVVAPPISKGIFKPCLSISLATWIISSKDGVIRPDKPMMSAFSSIAVCKIFSHGVMTPRSITLEVWKTTSLSWFGVNNLDRSFLQNFHTLKDLHRSKVFILGGHSSLLVAHLKLLQPRTTPTMFFPISWTSPFTVANTMVPL